VEQIEELGRTRAGQQFCELLESPEPGPVSSGGDQLGPSPAPNEDDSGVAARKGESP
jgi:hypothetical protein